MDAGTIIGSVICGAIVGLSLGLTGGGGSLFAVPLLVYALGRTVEEAVSVSLASVGATALIGFFNRWRTGDVEFSTGSLFAVAGLIGAPLGTFLGEWISPAVTMLLFAGLMIVVSVRLWTDAADLDRKRGSNDAQGTDEDACPRDASGRLRMTSRCAVALLLVGAATGVLTGLFGVGGGFVIVPALVLFSRMPIRLAVGTSLMIVAVVSLAGIGSQLVAGRSIDPALTGLFLVGGLVGLFAGQAIGRRLHGTTLQRGFAVAIVAVAAFVIFQNLTPGAS